MTRHELYARVGLTRMAIASVKAAKLGAIIAVLGASVLATPQGFQVEEHLGLDFLFGLRGPRAAPEEVLIVSIDKPSIDRLCVVGGFPDKLCTDGKWWPRRLHADLVDRLAHAGASVIVFDLRFDTPRDEDDARLGAALARAGRVVLVEFLKREEFASGAAKASMETLVPPIEEIRKGALATAPFALPRVPVRVNAYSPFPHGAGDVATLPVVAFQVHALPAYAKLLEACPGKLDGLPPPPVDAAGFYRLVHDLRTRAGHAGLRQCMQALGARDPAASRTMEALLAVYEHQGVRYLDLYGPSRTLATRSYAEALQLLERGNTRDFAGKAVFVGVSGVAQPEQKDNYFTVFTRDDGVDIHGVELAATAFANLLENREVRWDYALALAIVALWGLAIGAISRSLSTPRAALAVSGLVAGYVAVAHLQFAHYALWLPLVVPLLLQAPAAFAFGALAQHRELSREKANIRTAFGHFLPDSIVDELARDVTRIPQHSQIVSGTCLATDIGGYTQIAETLDPGELRLVMNEYYTRVFNPVAEHHGIVSDVVGDAMVAIWAAATDDPALREQACRAALDISAAAEAFGRMPNKPALPTRIGLDSGQMALGNVGGMRHYEYRAVGDIVNTASRIQGLNKVLGTKVLMSAAAFDGVRGMLARHLGEFRLRGKLKPVSIFELTAAEPNVTEEQRWLCSRFGNALDALRAQQWPDAQDILLDVLERFPDDGPTRFYLQLLKRECGKAERWDGVVAVSSE